MAQIIPFAAIRPRKEKASRIAALPYDVYSREEAKAEVAGHPESFLRVDRAETQFDDSTDACAPQVYQRARDTLRDMVKNGDLIKDGAPFYYIYELGMGGRTQTGVAACASIDDYQNGVIKKHEKTRAEKEEDRVRHVDACDAQTGPIFLAYRARPAITDAVKKAKCSEPEYDFTADDGVTHRVWAVRDTADIRSLREAFSRVGQIYIADGHHRAASAVRVGLGRRRAHPGFDGTEEFNYFLSVLFPDEELSVMDYNRVVRDLNGMSSGEFMDIMREIFVVSPLRGDERRPREKGSFSMFFEGTWYLARIREEDKNDDPVGGLDVSLLQDLLLAPRLGITDPKVDERIDFVGGIRGTDELERRCRTDARVAFAMYPTSIRELFAVADAGRLMPPKSTWFEPKLRSGLFIHALS